jgi:AmmeMemoRadiSam system protein A
MPDVYVPPTSQRKLLALARQTLEDSVRGSLRCTDEFLDSYLLRGDYGAFVSLHKNKELRGCIGTCAPKLPLYLTVIAMTEAAASRDRRMKPVSLNELEDIRIGISILSPLQATPDPLSLSVGTHGLYIARGKSRGVLLPQVATEHGWDIQQFLKQTCLKAGLPENAWYEPDTRISSFTALIIEESS